MDVTKYMPLIRTLASRYRRYGELDDLIQIGCLGLLQAGPVPEGVEEGAHAYMLVRRALYSHARSCKRDLARRGGLPLASLDFAIDGGNELYDQVAGPGRIELELLDAPVLIQAIAGLDGTEREVMVAIHVEGLTTSQAAERLGLSGFQVRATEAKAIDRLRKRLRVL